MAFLYKTVTSSLLGAVCSLTLSISYASDLEAGKRKSVMCAACHGANGMSPVPIYPNLAGQKEQYLMSALTAYKNGERNNSVMSPMAAPLSDNDIKNLAAYYASLTCE